MNIIKFEGLGLKLVRIGVNDKFGQSGTASELLDYYGLSSDKIAEVVTNEMKKKICIEK